MALAWGKHLFPFRTEQLSPTAPMVLVPQGTGRVGRRRFFTSSRPRAARASLDARRRRVRIRALAGPPVLPDQVPAGTDAAVVARPLSRGDAARLQACAPSPDWRPDGARAKDDRGPGARRCGWSPREAGGARCGCGARRGASICGRDSEMVTSPRVANSSAVSKALCIHSRSERLFGPGVVAEGEHVFVRLPGRSDGTAGWHRGATATARIWLCRERKAYRACK